MNPFEIDAKKLTNFVLSRLQPLLLPPPSAKRGHVRGVDDGLGARLPLELLDLGRGWSGIGSCWTGS